MHNHNKKCNLSRTKLTRQLQKISDYPVSNRLRSIVINSGITFATPSSPSPTAPPCPPLPAKAATPAIKPAFHTPAGTVTPFHWKSPPYSSPTPPLHYRTFLSVQFHFPAKVFLPSEVFPRNIFVQERIPARFFWHCRK